MMHGLFRHENDPQNVGPKPLQDLKFAGEKEIHQHLKISNFNLLLKVAVVCFCWALTLYSI